LALLILLPGAAIVMTLNQQKMYQASADILVNQTDIAAALAGSNASASNPQEDDRFAATQAALAGAPAVARLAIAQVPDAHVSVDTFLHRSSVVPKPNTNIMTMSVSAPTPASAIALTRAYTSVFLSYTRRNSSAQIQAAHVRLQARLAALVKRGAKPGGKSAASQLFAQLLTKDSAVQSLQSVLPSNVSIVRVPDTAQQTEPRPVRSVILAVALALVLGLAFALVRQSLDTRIASADEMQRTLGVPLLARLPKPPDAPKKSKGVSPLLEADGAFAEGFSVVRAALGPNIQDRGHPWVLMVTGAVIAEGKSSCSVGLASSFARGGRNVLLIDADLRRPSLHRIVGAPLAPGLSELLTGDAEFADLVRELPMEKWAGVHTSRLASSTGHASSEFVAEPDGSPAAVSQLRHHSPTGGSAAGVGTLSLVSAGSGLLSPQDVLGQETTKKAIGSLAQKHDIVIVDTPPVLVVGDAVALAASVDAVVVVAAANKLTRPMAKELGRVLEQMAVSKVGFLTTGVGRSDPSEYHYSYGSGYPKQPVG
jgi:Mrp family chromosome partitioning ATPase